VSYIWNSVWSELASEESSYDRKTCYTLPSNQEINVDFPPLHRLGSFWYTISTVSHIFSLILNFVLILELVKKYIDIYPNIICFLPRLVLHETMTQSMTIWVGFTPSLLNLVWRFGVVRKRRLKLYMIIFTLSRMIDAPSKAQEAVVLLS